MEFLLLLVLAILPATLSLPIDTNNAPVTNQQDDQNKPNVTWEFPVKAPPTGKDPDFIDPTTWRSHLLGAEPKSAVQHQILDFPLHGGKDAKNPSGSPQFIIDLPGSIIPNSMDFPVNGDSNPPNPFGSPQQGNDPSQSVVHSPMDNKNSLDSSNQIVDLSGSVLPNSVNFPWASSQSSNQPVDLSGSVMTGPVDFSLPGNTEIQNPLDPSHETINLSRSTFQGNPDSNSLFGSQSQMQSSKDTQSSLDSSPQVIDLSGNVIPVPADSSSSGNPDSQNPFGSQITDISGSVMPGAMEFPPTGNQDAIDPLGSLQQNPNSIDNQMSSSLPQDIVPSGFVLPDPVDFPLSNGDAKDQQKSQQQAIDNPGSMIPADFQWGGSVNPADGSSSFPSLPSDSAQSIAAVDPSDVVQVDSVNNVPPSPPNPVEQTVHETTTHLIESAQNPGSSSGQSATQNHEDQVNSADKLPPNPFSHLETNTANAVNQESNADMSNIIPVQAADTQVTDQNSPTNVFPRIVQSSDPSSANAIDITANNLDSAQAHFIDFWLQNPDTMLTDMEGPAFGPPLPVMPDIPAPAIPSTTPSSISLGDTDHVQSGGSQGTQHGQDPHGHEGHDHAHAAENGNCGGVLRDEHGKITHIVDTHDCTHLPVIDSHITGGHAFDPHNGELLLALDAQSLAHDNAGSGTTGNHGNNDNHGRTAVPVVATTPPPPPPLPPTTPTQTTATTSLDSKPQSQTDVSGLTIAELKEQLRLAKINERKQRLLEKKKQQKAQQRERQLARKKAREEQARRRKEAREAKLQRKREMQAERKRKRLEAKRRAMERAKARREQRAKKQQEMKRKRQQMRRKQQQKKQAKSRAAQRAARRRKQRQQRMRRQKAKAKAAQARANSDTDTQMSADLTAAAPVEDTNQQTSSVSDFLKQRRLEKMKRLRHYAG